MRPKIVLLGMLTKIPVGGVMWLVRQYAVGFQRLGFDVYYVEAHGRVPSMFMEDEHDDGTGKAVAFLADQMARNGMEDRWAFHAVHDDGRCYGLSRAELERLYRDAALVVNLHGGTVPLEEHAVSGRLVYMGTDPVELELELHRGERQAIEFLEPHVAFFTWGLNYGNGDCRLPWSERFPFVPSPPPVVLDLWQDAGAGVEPAVVTTVGNWRQHWRDVTFEGEVYTWSKHHEFLKILDLPGRVDQRFELALSSYDEVDCRLLEAHGWAVRPGSAVSADPETYRSYIVGSRGELTVAKDQNVRLRTGWFSERSATYLAAGRPVIQQDTGFGSFLPTGKGVLTFSDLDGAVAAVEAVNADYGGNRKAATEVAREYFNYDVVLGDILDHMGMDVPTTARRPHAARRASSRLPDWLELTPLSRRPPRLPDATVAAVQARPVPRVQTRYLDDPVASVVVVTFDNLTFTRMALESVLATSDPPFELIVVDNASAEDTRRYLSVLAAKNRNVRVILNATNRGFAAASNQGLRAARGEICVLLNNDTIVTPGWLGALVAHARDPAVGLVGPSTNRCGNNAEVPTTYRTHGSLLTFAAERCSEGRFDITTSIMFCTALRRAVFEQLGPLDERFGIGMFEDDDYSRRVRQAGLRVQFVEDAFVHHFGEASFGTLASSGQYSALFEKNRKQFEDKWGVVWAPHERRRDPSYDELVTEVRRDVERLVPPRAVVAVVSKGDERLVDLGERTVWHFPCLEAGDYAGFYPADGAAAVAHLDALIERGLEYIVIPTFAVWWLEHYPELGSSLDRYDVLDAGDSALIFDLRPVVTGAKLADRHRDYRLRRLTEFVRAISHDDSAVVVVSPEAEDAAFEGLTATWLDPTCASVGEQLEELVRAGAKFAVVPAGPSEEVVGHAVDEALRGWRLVARRAALGVVYEVGRP